jgi:hypothetical protein
VILGVALLLRLLALPLPLSLSDDAYRYLWDGKLAVAGFNPYALAPDDEKLVHLRDDLWQQVAHREVETVYPPLALGLFSIASRAPRPVLMLKAILVAVDLLACVALVMLCRRRGVSELRSLAWAWNPLVVLEVAGMGHVDVLGIAPLIAAAALLSGPDVMKGGRRVLRSATVGLGVALGVLAKLVPLLLLPAWLRVSRPRAAFVAVVALVVVGASAPFLVGLGGVPPGLVTYGVSWEFNGPIFEPLWRGLDWLGVAPLIKSGLDRVSGWTGTGRQSGWLQTFVYPQLLAKLLLAAGLVPLLLWSARSRDPSRAALRVFGGWLVLSATVYPWYLLWVLPWAATAWSAPWLVASASAFAAYLPRLFGVALWPWAYLAVWIPPLLMWLVRRRTV